MSQDAEDAGTVARPAPEVRRRIGRLADFYLKVLRRGRDLAAAHPEAAPLLEGELRLCHLLLGASSRSPDRGGPGARPAGGDRAGGSAPAPKPAPEPAAVADPDADVPRRLGRYELREVLGRGMSAVVYRAYDPHFDREVALKVLHEVWLGDEPTRQRFERDARIAGRLRHPHIVPLHETGAAAGGLYLDMELVRGRTLQALLDEGPLPLREGVALVRKLAEALHYAHEQGIVHRDVKAQNVLLDERLEPQLTDFGLARREQGDETLTEPGQILGTLDTMSPEQAAGRGRDADRRTDVYSLGVVLYQVLTGRLPFQREGSWHQRLQRIQFADPPAPRAVNPALPRGLEAVCLRALAKAPADRFATCQELADELQRWLADEPLKTRPAGPWERGRRWLRRHRAATAAGLGLVVALLLAWTAGVWQAGRNAAAARAEVEIRSLLVRAWTRLANPSWGRRREVQDLLRQTAEHRWRLPPSPLREELDRDVRSVYAASLGVLDVAEAPGAPLLRFARVPEDSYRMRRCAALRPDGTAVIAAGDGVLLRLPVAASGPPVRLVESLQIRSYLAYGPDGRRLAWAREDGRLTVHDGDTLEVVAASAGAGAEVLGLGFTARDGRLWWCRADGEVGSWSPAGGAAPAWRLPGPVTAAAFAPGAERLVVADRDGRFAVYGTDGQQQHRWESLPADWGAVDQVALAPDPDRVAVSCKGGVLLLGRLDDAPPRRPTCTQQPCLAEHRLEFSPDGRWLAWNATETRLLDVMSGRIECRALMAVCGWSADGRRLMNLSIAPEHPLLYDVHVPEVFTPLAGHGAAPVALAWSGDGSRLASLDARYEVRTWDRARGLLLDAFVAKPMGQFAGNCGLALDGDGGRLLFVSGTEKEGRGLLRAPRERRDLASWPVETGYSYAGHDGERFVVVREELDRAAERAGEPEAWPAKSVLYEVAGDGPWRGLGTLRPAGPDDRQRIISPKLSEDGRRYLWEGPRAPVDSRRVEVWDVAKRQCLVRRAIPPHETNPGSVPDSSLSLDGRWVWISFPRPGDGGVRLDLNGGDDAVVNGLMPRVADPAGRWRVGGLYDPSSPPYRGRRVLMRGAGDEVWLHLPCDRPANNEVRMSRADGGRYVAWGQEDGTVVVADLLELERQVLAFEREIHGP